MMNFEEFCNYVENEVLSVLHHKEGKTAIVKDVHKNNGVVLKGLTILEEGKRISPTIYLEEFYEEMVIENSTEEEILSEIASAYEKCLKEIPEFDIMGNLTEEQIIGVLVNQEHNEELLKDIPHLLIGDSLAVIFKYLLEKSERGYASVTITDYLAQMKGYDEHTLMRIALSNTPKLLKYSFQSMGSVISAMMGVDCEEENDNSDFPMYVLSNQQNQWGAFCILYPQVLEKLFSKFGSDLVMLPSSVHELIILPQNEDMIMSDMDKMVQEVNATQVGPQDRLADKAFVLRRDGSDDISKFVSYYAPQTIGC